MTRTRGRLGRFELANLSVVIPVRIDSPDRTRNVMLVLDYFKRYFSNLEVLLIEQDKQSRLSRRLKQRPEVDHVFRNTRGCFHKTRVLNLGIALSSRRYILAYDTDVLFRPEAIQMAYEQLVNDMADAVYPYNGVMLQIKHSAIRQSKSLDRAFFRSLPFRELGKDMNCGGFCELLYGGMSWPCVGGALMFNKRLLLECGGYNENIVSYGAEDGELDIRLRRLGRRIRRLSSFNCYHLEHHRGADSRYNNFKDSNIAEREKVRSMDAGALRRYVHDGFRHLVLDLRDRIRISNTETRYCMVREKLHKRSLDEISLIICSARAGRGDGVAGRIDQQLARLEQEYKNYEVIVMELSSMRLRDFHMRAHTVYKRVARIQGWNWLTAELKTLDRPFVALLGPACDDIALLPDLVAALHTNDDAVLALPGGIPRLLLSDRVNLIKRVRTLKTSPRVSTTGSEDLIGTLARALSARRVQPGKAGNRVRV